MGALCFLFFAGECHPFLKGLTSNACNACIWSDFKNKVFRGQWVKRDRGKFIFNLFPNFVDVNAPKLPGGMNVWLVSPSGRPARSARLNLRLLSNLLKNVPERRKSRQPLRIKTLRAWKKVKSWAIFTGTKTKNVFFSFVLVMIKI